MSVVDVLGVIFMGIALVLLISIGYIIWKPARPPEPPRKRQVRWTQDRFNHEADLHAAEAVRLRKTVGQHHPAYLAEVRAVKQLRKLAKHAPKE